MATLAAGEGESGLRRVARLLHEAAGQFYLDDSRRRLTLHNERRNPPADLNARVAFKVCVSVQRPCWAAAMCVCLCQCETWICPAAVCG